ncbi:hypothetical protein Hanom_Chr09g00778141 [Helianthus anomalus]
MVDADLGSDVDFWFSNGAIIDGGWWYSTWSNIGVGGSLARRSVRSTNGGTATVKPRALSDHVLMKCRAESPSANVWCSADPKETPPHLNRVT